MGCNIPSDLVQENKIIPSSSLKKPHYVSQPDLLFMEQVEGLKAALETLNSWS